MDQHELTPKDLAELQLAATRSLALLYARIILARMFGLTAQIESSIVAGMLLTDAEEQDVDSTFKGLWLVGNRFQGMPPSGDVLAKCRVILKNRFDYRITKGKKNIRYKLPETRMKFETLVGLQLLTGQRWHKVPDFPNQMLCYHATAGAMAWYRARFERTPSWLTWDEFVALAGWREFLARCGHLAAWGNYVTRTRSGLDDGMGGVFARKLAEMIRTGGQLEITVKAWRNASTPPAALQRLVKVWYDWEPAHRYAEKAMATWSHRHGTPDGDES